MFKTKKQLRALIMILDESIAFQGQAILAARTQLETMKARVKVQDKELERLKEIEKGLRTKVDHLEAHIRWWRG